MRAKQMEDLTRQSKGHLKNTCSLFFQSAAYFGACVGKIATECFNKLVKILKVSWTLYVCYTRSDSILWPSIAS